MEYEFTKMNATGNTFVVIDVRGRQDNPTFSDDNIHFLANPKNETTKGCDQVLIIRPPKNTKNSCYMEIRNRNGSEAEACGNGTMAIAKFLFIENNYDNSGFIETLSGHLKYEILGASIQDRQQVYIWMPIPTGNLKKPVELCVELCKGTLSAYLVDVGNPHAIFFMKERKRISELRDDANKFGAKFGNHKKFPQGKNISFASLDADNGSKVNLAVWERGVGLTKACGTAAIATAYVVQHYIHTNGIWSYADIRSGDTRAERQEPNTQGITMIKSTRIQQYGGSIDVILGEEYRMTGIAETEFTSHIELPTHASPHDPIDQLKEALLEYKAEKKRGEMGHNHPPSPIEQEEKHFPITIKEVDEGCERLDNIKENPEEIDKEEQKKWWTIISEKIKDFLRKAKDFLREAKDYIKENYLSLLGITIGIASLLRSFV